MIYAADPSGTERGYYRTKPALFIECVPPPSDNHIMSANWQADPMNEAVCWVLDEDLVNKKRAIAINATAQEKIITYLGATQDNFIIKELNLLMLNAELDQIVLGGGVLTPEQKQQKQQFILMKDKIKAIRQVANDAETNKTELNNILWP